VATMFASLIMRRGPILALAAVIAALFGAVGHPLHEVGFWDGPH